MSKANILGFLEGNASPDSGLRREPPRPLRDSWRGKPFPAHALPEVIREAIYEVVRITQAPLAMVGSSALATISACVQDVVSVRRDSQLEGPVGLYFLVIAKSGERKTTVDKFFNEPIRGWEGVQREIAKALRAEHMAAMESWDAAKQGLKDAQRKATSRDGSPNAEIAEQLRQHEFARPQEPRVAFLLRGDETPEAFAAGLVQWPIAYSLNSEAGLIFGGPAMSPDALMRNLSQYNIAWDGGRIKRSRTTGQNVDIEGMRVTVFWQMQPEVLSTFVEKAGALAKGMGFFARFLICEPASTQGSRTYEPPALQTPYLDAYKQRLTEVLSWPRSVDEHGRIHTHVVGLDEFAEFAWVEFHNRVEEQLEEHGRYRHIQGFASKAAEQVARLACLLEVFCPEKRDRATNGEFKVGASAMGAAIDVLDWFLDEAVRLHEQSFVPHSVVLAEQLEEWIARQLTSTRRHFVTLTDIAQRGPNPTREAKVRDAALELLDDHKRLLRFTEGGKNVVALVPEVLQEWIEIFSF